MAQVTSTWPRLRVSDWQETRDTLHMWTQIVGKACLALAPMTNHWWGVTFRVTASGLMSPLLPYRRGGIDFAFDLLRHTLSIRTTSGEHRDIALAPRSVADFYREFTARLDELDVDLPLLGRPVEVPVAIPFAEDEEHASYDAASVTLFWTSLVSTNRILTEFRSRFIGKASPVHFFWGAFDLACTRFSGRRAPRHPGGVPNCADWVMELAYSHEVSSCGYWPGGDGEGIFYSYAYPESEGFRERVISPSAARYDQDLQEFVLPYEEAIALSRDPDATLLAFFQSTYEAAAETSAWDQASLEAAR